MAIQTFELKHRLFHAGLNWLYKPIPCQLAVSPKKSNKFNKPQIFNGFDVHGRLDKIWYSRQYKEKTLEVHDLSVFLN